MTIISKKQSKIKASMYYVRSRLKQIYKEEVRQIIKTIKIKDNGI